MISLDKRPKWVKYLCEYKRFSGWTEKLAAYKSNALHKMTWKGSKQNSRYKMLYKCQLRNMECQHDLGIEILPLGWGLRPRITQGKALALLGPNPPGAAEATWGPAGEGGAWGGMAILALASGRPIWFGVSENPKPGHTGHSLLWWCVLGLKDV